jgi:16S rRNA (guanine1516-N2)-methyltransferase
VVTLNVHDPETETQGRRLARELGLAFRDRPAAEDVLLLVAGGQRLELRENRRGTRPILVDFAGGPTGFRRRSGLSRRQPMAKALGLSKATKTVVDATAGLGRDAFLLACLGCEVLGVERSPVLFALLRDGVKRAEQARSASLRHLMSRLRFVRDDSRRLLSSCDPASAPDAVYIDPMFPAKGKAALSKKEMRICRDLVGDDEDASELVGIARRVARRRVVVKRPPRATPLAPRPDLQYEGKQVRYDVYLAGQSAGD